MKKLILIALLSIATVSCDGGFSMSFVIEVEDKLYRCMDCGCEFRRDSSDYNKTCPECNSPNTEIVE